MTPLRCVSWLTLLAFATAGLAQTLDDDPCVQGQRYFQDDNYIAAEPFLQRCLERGESLEALLPLTVITVLQERVDEGLDYGARALAVAPDNARVRYWYGRALLVAGEAEAAMHQWELGLERDVAHLGILEGLGRLSLQQGNDARAYNLFLQMRMQGTDDLWLHEMLSTLARRRGLWGRAATHWQDLVNIDGRSEENLVILGELMILAGQTEDALAVFQDAVASSPSGVTWGGLGEAWFAMNEVDSAAVALRRAVDLAPENPHNRFNLANALQIMGDLEGAEQQFTSYLETAPDDPIGHFKYGVHLELRGEDKRALAEVERAVALDSRYIEALVVLAQMYQERGLVDEALSTLTRLEQLDPGAAEELTAWKRRVEDERASRASNLASGKVMLQHIIVADVEVAGEVERALATGKEFASLASRYSSGPTAARGGDLGWVNPQEMMPELQAAISELAPGELTSPIAAGGFVHFFKRVR